MKPVDLLYMGLGAAFMAKDKIQEFLDELEKRGTMSQSEAKSFLEDAKERARQQEEAVCSCMREQLRKTLEEMNLATKDDIAELKALLVQKTL